VFIPTATQYDVRELSLLSPDFDLGVDVGMVQISRSDPLHRIVLQPITTS
jgi:hypothetical protein